MPDRKLPLKDEYVPNLKNLLLKPKKEGEKVTDSDKSTIDQIISVLKEKL